MKSPEKARFALDQKFEKVQKTPVSFAFFVAIHDFIEHIESNPVFSKMVSSNAKANLELNIPKKYAYLKEIYHGLEDIDGNSGADLGHARYAAIRELTSIRNNDVSDSNSFWKKRELMRKTAGEIHKVLHARLSGSSDAKASATE